MIRLILGRAGAGKTARVFEEIAALVAEKKGGIVLLVPEQYSHEAERELCRAAGDALSGCGEVLSFTGLARRVLSERGGPRLMMDGGGRLLCMISAVRDASDRLRIYGKKRPDARLAESLLAAMHELRSAGVGPEKMNECAERLSGALGDKMRDMALLTEFYTAAARRSGADPADVIEVLASKIGESSAARCTYYIDGFSDFTALEKDVLSKLISLGADMTVCLTLAPGGDGDSVFALAARTRRWFADEAKKYGRPVREEWVDPGPDGTALSWFCGHLFDFSNEKFPAYDGSVLLATGADVHEECELAASRMAELARGGVRWREMAVAVRGFGDYRAALENACDRYGVPLFMSGRGDMLRKSVPLLIGCALDAVTRGYEYESVFGYLKTGLAPVSVEDCDRLENYVILWNVRGTMWDRPFTMHPDGYNHPFDDDAKQRLAGLNALRERVIAPLRALEEAAAGADTAAGQAKALADFLLAIKLPERLSARAGALDAAGRAETAAEYERLWDVVCSALEQFAAVLGEMSMDAALFRELFCLMLSKYDVNLIPVSLDRVQAGDMDGMRRRHIRHLFVLGASDGRLPAPDEGGGVFTPEDREELAGKFSLPMGGAEESLCRELGIIYSCLTLPSETLYISWPRTDSEGTETRPSAVALRAMDLFELEAAPGDILRARTFSEEAAYSLAVGGEAGSKESVCLAARDYFEAKGRGPALRALVSAARAGRGTLSPDAVRALYGNKPGFSATRAGRFADCRFEYFLQYGLKAKPRQRAAFDQRDYGTFVHDILENVARGVMDEGGFASVTRKRVGELTDLYVDKYIHEEMNDFAEKSERFEFLFRRLRHTVRHVTEDMWEELKDAKFRPIDLELDLTAEGVLDPSEDDGEFRAAGRADRVDGWVKDGVLYLRVTDYKTGKKQFDLADVCEGINMQMLMYLFTLEKRGRSHFGAEEIRPAGVLYSPARFETVHAETEPTDEELAALRRTSAKRSGLILNDPEVVGAMEPIGRERFLPVRLTSAGGWSKESEKYLASLEQFGALSGFIEKTLRDMARELRAGSVAADPWYRSVRDNACARCDYVKACMFDEARDTRRIRMGMSPDAAWKKIRGEDDE